MELQFWGAARSVTGSMHLLTVNGSRILLDCGLFQGHRAEAYERNRNFPFDASTIDAVVLSHAHIDHAGNLPNLVRQGFHGLIYSTSATRNLANVMLYDSAYIQQRDAEFMSKRHSKRGLSAVQPLYTTDDVFSAIGMFVGISYHARIPVAPGVWVTFNDAGHLLGSAVTVIEAEEKGKIVKLGFTGDLGRKNLPILRDPEQIDDVDYLISESTYGGRIHEPAESMKERLLGVIVEAVERGGKLLIPSFAVGRAQEVIYILFQLFDEGKLPQLPIFIDSPLTINTTEVFRLHPECFDKEMLAYLHQRDDPFGFDRLKFVRTVDESKALNDHEGPCIIMAGSGMCEAGRIVHHLYNSVENPQNTVLIVGFQAEHTLGRRIVERQPEIPLLGDVKKLNAQVRVLNAFSGHAGQDELAQYITNANSKRLKRIFLVHGEPTQAEALMEVLSRVGIKNISLPVRGEKADLRA